MNHSQVKTAIVVGASGGIAQALITKLLQADADRHVIAISRSPEDKQAATASNPGLHWLQSDNSEESMAGIARDLGSGSFSIDRLFICNGVLHQHAIAPEKRLKSVDRDALHAVFGVNAFVPILWLKHLLPLMPGNGHNAVTVFSARVGSIEDNRAGGWYAYRASKAALNMLLKTAAIEHRRFARNTRFLAFHPGTTDTALSAPFQQGVSPDKLFSPDFVAERLLQIVEALPAEPTLNFLDWEGKAVAW
jgi:NAD(P)-dependent dehydrogenase (short-subunit alcohol dehydrogenase family)